jgi:hypothetical protein
MRTRTIWTAAATAAASVILVGGPANAGEVTGTGGFTPNHTFGHAQSICSFSGLEDGDGHGFPGPGQAPPQNWGHSKELYGSTPAERKASGSHPGDSCNGHTGWVVNPPF